MPEMNNFIQVPFRVDGWNSTKLLNELNEAGFETQITKRHFSTGSTGGDFFNLFLEVTPYAFGVLSAVLVAYVKKGKKVRIHFENGQLTDIDADNYSVKEFTKILESAKLVKRIDVSDD